MSVTPPIAPASIDPEAIARVERLLQATLAAHASDLHLRPGQPPFVRVDGALARTRGQPLLAAQLEELISVTSGRRLQSLDPAVFSFEYAFQPPGMARFRCHAFKSAEGWSVAARAIPTRVPTFAELRLPPAIKQLADPGPGLVLICGPTGSGKSTTCAALLRAMGSKETLHMLCIEDPIEHLMSDLPSCVTQREVGRDVPSHSAGLKSALREDPDVLFVSEIRDLESLELALQAAEAGMSVYATFHTSTAAKTLQRLVALFPTEDMAAARVRIADTLRAILTQRLLPRRNGRGRVLATEVMLGTYGTRDVIRDPNRLATLPSVLERANDQLMHTFDQSLLGLVREEIIAAEVALRFAQSPADLRRALSLG